MGRDKALLPMGNSTLVEHLAGLLARVVDSVSLVGCPDRYTSLDMPVLDESFPGCGPLSGIEAALRSGIAEWNLILACDLPLLETELLERLVVRAAFTSAAAVVPIQDDGRLEPLCAIYHARCLPPVEKALVDGRFKLRDLLPELEIETIRPNHPDALRNVNTPEEWAVLHQGETR